MILLEERKGAFAETKKAVPFYTDKVATIDTDAVRVNGDRYRAMLNEFLFTKIEDEDIGNIWF